MLISLRSPRETPAAEADLVSVLLDCHGKIRSFTALARAVAARDDLRADERREACDGVLRYFAEALPLHVEDEERSLLPRLRGTDPALDRALDQMSAEHREHHDDLAALADTCARVREDPSPERRAALASVAARIEAAFARHLDQEERVVFAAVRSGMSAEAQAEVRREMRARRERA
jgi:hemerythrin-like domain-containing protein